MICTYKAEINGKSVEKYSLLELSQLYYISGSKLSNQKIFSTEEIVGSVMAELAPILSRTAEIKADKTKRPVTTFISDVNTEIFKSIKLDQHQLAPKYDEKYRILHYILDAMPEQYKSKIHELEELQTLILKETSLQRIYDEKYKEIKSTIESEQLSTELGVELHKGISLLIKGQSLNKIVDNIIPKPSAILDNVEA